MPGDIVLLASGRNSADLRLVEVDELRPEAALTGESVPVEKQFVR